MRLINFINIGDKIFEILKMRYGDEINNIIMMK